MSRPAPPEPWPAPGPPAAAAAPPQPAPRPSPPAPVEAATPARRPTAGEDDLDRKIRQLDAEIRRLRGG